MTPRLPLCLIALLATAPAHAGPHGCADVAARPGAVTTLAGGDRIVLAPHPTAAAELCYWNGDQVSHLGEHAVELDGLVVRVHVQVGDAETLTVTVPPGYMIHPAAASHIRVEDNAAATALIYMGVS